MPAKKKTRTPLSHIRHGFRLIWMRSRERAAARAAANNSCECCGVKGRAKDTKNGPKLSLHVHHIDGIDWTGLAELYQRRVLPHPDRLKVLCPKCHKEEHERMKEPQGAAQDRPGPTISS